MAQSEKEPMQRTPQGAEIPVPKRGDLMRDMRKIAKAKPPKAKRSTPSRPVK